MAMVDLTELKQLEEQLQEIVTSNSLNMGVSVLVFPGIEEQALNITAAVYGKNFAISRDIRVAPNGTHKRLLQDIDKLITLIQNRLIEHAEKKA